MSSFVPVHTFLIPVRMSVMAGPAQEWEEYRSARLHDAAAYGELACLDKLLSEGTDPDWVNPATGLTPLLIASMNGRAKCVLSLLHAGADIYAADPQGSTALELFIKLKTTRRSMSTVPSDHTECHSLPSSFEIVPPSTPTGSRCATSSVEAATTRKPSSTWRRPMPTASAALGSRCSTIRAWSWYILVVSWAL